MTHELKTWPSFFEAVISGAKTFEIRRSDRPYAVGDILRLMEFDPGVQKYTGSGVTVLVTYLMVGGPFGVPDHVVMSIRKVSDPFSL